MVSAWPCAVDDGRAEPISDLNHFAGLSIIELMSSLQTRVRAEARKAKATRLGAYQIGRIVSTSARGFHRSRIEGDFPMHSRREWQAEREEWSKKVAAEFEEVEEILVTVRSSHEKMIAALTRGY
jgi:hypothetical protein